MEAPVCALMDAMFRLPAKLDGFVSSHGHMLPRGADDEIPLIKQDLEKTVAILQDHDNFRAEDSAMMVKCLVKEVRELSYDMEDSIDQYEHAAGSWRGIVPRRKKSITRRSSKTTRLPEKLKWRLWIANKIREFSMRSQELVQRYSLFNLSSISNPASTSTSRHDTSFYSWHPTSYREHADHPVGIDAPMNMLEAWLAMDADQKLKVVSIVGSGGIGKTTLANELYHRIGKQYECQAFVRTSKSPDVRRLLVSMLSQVRPHQPPHNWKVHNLIADIRAHLQDKRYLIVIDGVWATSTWDIIHSALPDGNICSAILITTEIEDVAPKCCANDFKYVFKMKPLGDDDSRKLFFNTAFGPQYVCPPELREVSNNIIRKCGGLPLATITVASLLLSRMGKPEQWDHVNKSLGYGLRKDPTSEGMKQVLNLVYNNLPQHLKACMMYLSIYKEGYIIQKDDLVKQWIAEGFICATKEKDKEEISRSYFDELINSRMIQPVHMNDNGDVLSCTVHHMVLDFIVHKSIEENFVTTIDHSQTAARLADKVRRLSLQFGNAEATPPINMRLSQVRTLAFFGGLKCVPSIPEFHLLQVLILHLWGDDEGISFDLTGISELFRLRYLYVTCNVTLEVQGTQIRGLQYLETLKIDARISAVPSNIVHLPGLLHLSLPVETNLPDGIGQMTSLCTLGYFDLSVNSIENVQSLGELTNLQDLQLTCSTVPCGYLESKIDNMGSILPKLSNLKSLTLEPSSILEVGPSNPSISCDGLSSVSSPPALLQKFEWLPHICMFSSLPKWIGHLGELCILKIGVMKLARDDVDVLGGLPALVVLSLYVCTKPAERIVFNKAGFLVLKYFKFRCSVPWLKFEVDAMPNLQKLKLDFDAHGVGHHSITIPVGIEYLSSLKEISAKIGGVGGADDPDRRAAESVLSHAIMMHPGRPSVNIQSVDGMIGSKDDKEKPVPRKEGKKIKKSGTQEEERKKVKKPYHDFMNVGSLQESSREDADTRNQHGSSRRTGGSVSGKHGKGGKGGGAGGKKPIKVAYISNPMRVKTSAEGFYALVQELTGQHADPSKYSTDGFDDDCDGAAQELSLEGSVAASTRDEAGRPGHTCPAVERGQPDFATAALGGAEDDDGDEEDDIFRKALPKRQVRVSTIDEVMEDDLSWGEHHQKDIRGAKYPRTYYQCLHRHSKGCRAIKEVQQRTDGHPLLFDVVYSGNHTCTQEQSSASVGVKTDGEAQGLEPLPSGRLAKPGRSPLVRATYTKEGLATYDGHRWRKYGQKLIQGHEYPIKYYRCAFRSDQGCTAAKKEQRTGSDPPVWQVTYHGKHSCADPSVQPTKEQSSVSVGVTASSSMSPATSGSQVTYEAVSGSSGRILTPRTSGSGSQVTYEEASRSTAGVCFPATSGSQVTYQVASGSSTAGFRNSIDELDSMMNSTTDEFDWTTNSTTDGLQDLITLDSSSDFSDSDQRP